MKNKLTTKKRDLAAYIIYSAIFTVLAILIYGGFFYSNGFSLVWKADGLVQHCLALTYYGDYLRGILRNIFVNFSFDIPMFDFSIGYGADIISTLLYYCIGDPLNLLSVFFKPESTEYLYSFLVVFRMYLAGLAFSVFMKSKGRSNTAIVAGAISYAFTGYVLYAAVKHPFFIIGMMYLPLMCLGVDNVFNGKSPAIYIASVALVVISNFYGAYMACIFMLIYALLVYLSQYLKKGIKFLLASLGKFAVFSVNALLIPMIIFLPQVYNVLSIERLNTDNAVNLFFNIGYYRSLFDVATNPSRTPYWLVIGVSGVALFAIITQLIKIKKRVVLGASVIISIVFISFPIFGHILNGFTYVSNRWSWVIGFVASAAISYFVDDMNYLTAKERKWTLILSMVYIASVFCLYQSRTEITMIMLIVMVVTAFVAFSQERLIKNPKNRKRVIAMLCVFSVLMQSTYMYSRREGNYISQFMYTGKTYEYMVKHSPSAAVDYYIKDDEFYRYEPYKNPIINDSLLNDTNSTSFFFSTANPVVSKFVEEIGLNLIFEQKYQNLNNRLALQYLTGAKYIVGGGDIKLGHQEAMDETYIYPLDVGISLSENDVVYAFGNVDAADSAVDKYTFQCNDKVLPFGYTYDTVMSREEYSKLSLIQKQGVLLQTAVTDADTSLKKASVSEDVKTIDLFDNIVSTKDIEVSGHTLNVLKDEATLSIKVPFSLNSEAYLEVIGFLYDDVSQLSKIDEAVEKKLGEKKLNGMNYTISTYDKRRLADAKKYFTKAMTTQVFASLDSLQKISSFTYYTSENPFYSGFDTYAVNLGYSYAFLNENEKNDVLTLKFTKSGEYSFDELLLSFHDISHIKEYAKNRKVDVLENVVISESENHITGTISLDERKILATQIPYSEGWTVKVDGEEAELINVNTMFAGVYLEPGEHTIEFDYQTPYAPLAVALSAIGIVMFAATLMVYRVVAKKKDSPLVDGVSEEDENKE